MSPDKMETTAPDVQERFKMLTKEEQAMVISFAEQLKADRCIR